ncbi:MAG: UDP-2,3-diacylglucosamine diphosphatase [Ignavibacteria bacterium]
MGEKKHYFFSDVHLGFLSDSEEKAKERKLVSFLESIRNDAEKIYIVGDLFDCWIEYRRAVPKGFYRTLAKLNEIVEQGIEVNFFSGNHDFWLNTYLRDDVGLKLYRDSLVTELDGKKFFITHGDGLSKGDTGYKIIKKILRSPVNQFLYSLIHPDIGLWLAQGSSKKSRLHTDDRQREDETYSSEKDLQAHGSSGMREFASKKIGEGIDFVVMGHIHKPQYIELKENQRTGFYITLGDWIRNCTYGVYSNGNFELKKFG